MSRLFVGNLSFQATERDILQWLSGAGIEAESAQIVMDKDTGKSRGFGFIELGGNADATKAIAQLNETMFMGRAVKVDAASKPQMGRDRERRR